MASYHDKLICIRRELLMRRRVYPKWVLQGKIKVEQAQYEIQVMSEIEADYAALVDERVGLQGLLDLKV